MSPTAQAVGKQPAEIEPRRDGRIVQNRQLLGGVFARLFRPGGARESPLRDPRLATGAIFLHRFAAQKDLDSLKLHRHWLAVGGGHLEELALLEAKHSGEDVRRK